MRRIRYQDSNAFEVLAMAGAESFRAAIQARGSKFYVLPEAHAWKLRRKMSQESSFSVPPMRGQLRK